MNGIFFIIASLASLTVALLASISMPTQLKETMHTRLMETASAQIKETALEEESQGHKNSGKTKVLLSWLCDVILAWIVILYPIVVYMVPDLINKEYMLPFFNKTEYEEYYIAALVAYTAISLYCIFAMRKDKWIFIIAWTVAVVMMFLLLCLVLLWSHYILSKIF